jgi:hypothetical protein
MALAEGGGETRGEEPGSRSPLEGAGARSGDTGDTTGSAVVTLPGCLHKDSLVLSCCCFVLSASDFLCKAHECSRCLVSKLKLLSYGN